MVLLPEENPVEDLAQPRRDLLGLHIRDQVQIQFGTQFRNLLAQQGAALGLRLLLDALVQPFQELAQQVQFVFRFERKAMPDHASLQVEVEERGDQRVLEAWHHHHVPDEGVIHPLLALDAPAQGLFVLARHVVDDQDFEVRSCYLRLHLLFRLDLRRLFGFRIQRQLLVAVGIAGQHAVDTVHGDIQPAQIASLEPRRQLLEQAVPGKRPEPLDRLEHGQRLLYPGVALDEFLALPREIDQAAQVIGQIHPAIRAHFPNAAVTV